MLTSAIVFVSCLILFLFFGLFHNFIENRLGEWILILFLVAGATSVVSGIVYIGLSLNIPTEHRFKDSDSSQKSGLAKKIIIATVAIAVLAFIGIITFDCVSKKNGQKNVEEKVNLLIEMYQQSINELPLLYSDTAQVRKIFSRNAIMNSQSSLSDIYVIFIADVQGVPSLIGLGSWDYNETLSETGFKEYIYQCTTDCDYLIDILNGGEMRSFALYEYNTWYIYKPFESHGQRFIVRFSGN